jgi:hypothetical protein
MGFSYRLFNSMGDVDLADWQRVSFECGNSIFMDPRFIAAVEIGMRESCRFWHIIIYDEMRLPVACASLSAISLDLAHIAPPFVEAAQCEGSSLWLADFRRPEQLGAVIAVSVSTGPFNSGRSHIGAGNQDEVARNCLQGIWERGSGVAECIAGVRLSADCDPTDARFRRPISRL